MSPIRPEERDRYPVNWISISAWIRHVRAGGRCECDGRCGHDHGGRCWARNRERHPVTGSNVVLTVAHLDHTPEHSDDDNLLAMCQRCHLAYDREHHAETRARTRAGGPPLPFPAPRPLIRVVRVVGVSHAPGYPSNLLDLVHRIDHDDRVPVELVRDLDNGDDLNATAVHLEGRHLGWIPRQLAAGLAPRLAAGHQLQAHAVRVAIDPDHRDRPGLDIVLTEARP